MLRMLLLLIREHINHHSKKATLFACNPRVVIVIDIKSHPGSSRHTLYWKTSHVVRREWYAQRRDTWRVSTSNELDSILKTSHDRSTSHPPSQSVVKPAVIPFSSTPYPSCPYFPDIGKLVPTSFRLHSEVHSIGVGT